MRRALLILFLLCGAFVLLADGGIAQERRSTTMSSRALDCTAPKEVTNFKRSLPNTARAIRKGEVLTIVAIGSSSTEGIGASEDDRAYPVQLARALRKRWPDLKLVVVNKGVGGEDAQQMLQRFETDVLPYDPQLVIWQVGSNYALRSKDMDAYTAVLRKGINRLRTLDTDVILMDLQYAPRVLDKPAHRRIVTAMGELANDLKVAVFRRYAIMRHWVTSGKHQMQDIVARDRLHMNDASYGCIGRLLADSVSTAARVVSAASGNAPR